MNNRIHKKIRNNLMLHAQRLLRTGQKKHLLRTIGTLKVCARMDGISDYRYEKNWRERLDYCYDRINGGRAKALLRLIRKENALGISK